MRAFVSTCVVRGEGHWVTLLRSRKKMAEFEFHFFKCISTGGWWQKKREREKKFKDKNFDIR